MQAPADVLEPHGSITALPVEAVRRGGHRLESENGTGSFGKHVNGCPKTSHGLVRAVYDHTLIRIDKKVLVGRGLY